MNLDNENKCNRNNDVNDDKTDIGNSNATNIKINGHVGNSSSNNKNNNKNETWNCDSGSDEANHHTNGRDYKPKVQLAVTQKKNASSKSRLHIKTIEKDKKPTRPLSAYNLFFREERVNWLKEEKPAVGDDDDAGGNHPKSSSSQQHRPVFESMAKEVGKRWKELDETKRRKYIDMAKIETERYQCQLRQFKEQKKKDGRQQQNKQKNMERQQVLESHDAEEGAAVSSSSLMTTVAKRGDTTTATMPFADPLPSSSSAANHHQKGKEHPKRGDDSSQQQQLPPKKRIIMNSPNKRESNNNNNNAIEWSDRHDDDGVKPPEGNNNAKKKQKTMMNAIAVPSANWGSSNGEDQNQNQNNDSDPSSASCRQASMDGIDRDVQQHHLADATLTNEIMNSRGIKPRHPLLEAKVDGYPTMPSTMSADNHEQMLRERFLLMMQQQQKLAGLVDGTNATSTTQNDNSPTLPTTTNLREQETSSMIQLLLLRQQQQQLHDYPNGSNLPPSSNKIDLSMLSDEQLQLLAEQRGIRSTTKNNPLLDHPNAMLLANPKSLLDLYGSIGSHGMMGANVDSATNAAAAAAVMLQQQQQPTSKTTNPMQELLLRRHLLEQQQQQQQKLLYLQRVEQQQILQQQQQQQLQQKLKAPLPLPNATLSSIANNSNNNMSLVDEIRLRQRFGLPIPKHLLQELNGLRGSGAGMDNDDVVGIGGMFPKQRLTSADALLGGNLLHVGKGDPTSNIGDKISSPLLPPSATAAVDDDNPMLRNHNNDYKNMDRNQLLRLLAMRQQQQHNMIQSNNPYN